MPSIKYRTQAGQALEIEYTNYLWHIVSVDDKPIDEPTFVRDELTTSDYYAIKHQVQLARYGDKYFELKDRQ